MKVLLQHSFLQRTPPQNCAQQQSEIGKMVQKAIRRQPMLPAYSKSTLPPLVAVGTGLRLIACKFVA